MRVALRGQWRLVVVVCGLLGALSPVRAAPEYPIAGSVGEQRAVAFFFSDAAWGGVPFTEAEKQEALVGALSGRRAVRLEAEVTHLLSAPAARVRRFVAVFEVDGAAQPPTVRSGYELELLVPHSHDTLTVELENAETGIVNRVEVEPDGSL